MLLPLLVSVPKDGHQFWHKDVPMSDKSYRDFGMDEKTAQIKFN